MRVASGYEIVEYVAFLLLECGHRRHHSLHKAASIFTLGAKTPLTPQDARPNGALGGKVCGSGGGGIHVKTYSVLEALKQVYPRTRGIADSSEIQADTVLIEPMRFALPIIAGDGADRDYENNHALLTGLKECKSRKVLFCTEFSLLRMAPALRNEVVKVCDLVTTSFEFQRRLFKYININSNHILRDPISPMFLGNTDYKNRRTEVIATGNVSWEKNSQQVIEVFKALKGVVKRVYVGSASFWYDATNDPLQQRLQEELYKHTDEVVKECTLQQLAARFQQSRFGLWVAWHDTTATAVHEMLASGMLVTAAKHGLASEIPVWSASGVSSQVEAIKRLLGESDAALDEESKRASKWIKENASYEAFHKQVQQVLKAVW